MHLLKKIVDWSIFGNKYFWFHSMGGAVGAKLFLLMGLDRSQAFGLVVFIALMWEVLEYFIETAGHPDYIYGSHERWLYDSLGDIVGAIFMAGVVLL
jgi:hypothetical protein